MMIQSKNKIKCDFITFMLSKGETLGYFYEKIFNNIPI